jgi:hypothetical protein
MVNGNLTVVAYTGDNANISAMGKSFACKDAVISYNFTGTAKVSVLTIPIEFKIPVHYYYAKNVGLVKAHRANISIEIDLGLLGKQYYPVTGYESTLLNYTVNLPK